MLNHESINQTVLGKIVADKLVWVVVGDLKQTEAPVRALGLGEVVVVDSDGNPVPAAK